MIKYYIMKNNRIDDERISYLLFAVHADGTIEKITLHMQPEHIESFAYNLGHGAEMISAMDAIRMKFIELS